MQNILMALGDVQGLFEVGAVPSGLSKQGRVNMVYQNRSNHYKAFSGKRKPGLNSRGGYIVRIPKIDDARKQPTHNHQYSFLGVPTCFSRPALSSAVWCNFVMLFSRSKCEGPSSTGQPLSPRPCGRPSIMPRSAG